MICAVEQVARFRRNRAEVGGSAKVVDRSAIELGAGEEHRPAERSATKLADDSARTTTNYQLATTN